MNFESEGAPIEDDYVSILDYPSEVEGDLTVNQLSDDELRKRYDDAEIRRFLHVFSSYVTEVKSLDGVSASLSSADSAARQHQAPTDEVPAVDQTVSRLIAETLVVPNLPKVSNEAPVFTLGRVRLTTDRLYLALQTTYIPFATSIFELAIWKNFQRSLLSCSCFWVMWWHNMLLPALFLLLLVVILGRKLRPYPRVQELRDYHEQISQAEDFGSRLVEQISSPSPVSVAELWRLGKLASHTWKSKSKSKSRADKPSKGKEVLVGPHDHEHLSDNLSVGSPEPSPSPREDKSFQKQMEREEETDIDYLKQLSLHCATNVADLHERIQNIFLWRKPAATRRYTIALVGMMFATAFVPTQYLAKAVWFSVGFIFWHVIPVIYSLSPRDRWRIPPPLADVPTDAEYAMHLISNRVAAGQDVLPVRSKRRKPHAPPVEIGKPVKTFPGKSGVSAIGKYIVHEAQRIGAMTSDASARPSHPLVAGALAIALPSATSETYSYPCQFGSSPGLLTLTSKRLYFTTLFSESARREIDLDKISGVRKSGVLKGLQLSYNDGAEECELKFSWVNSRDELFARLVGIGNRRWRSV